VNSKGISAVKIDTGFALVVDWIFIRLCSDKVLNTKLPTKLTSLMQLCLTGLLIWRRFLLNTHQADECSVLAVIVQRALLPGLWLTEICSRIIKKQSNVENSLRWTTAPVTLGQTLLRAWIELKRRKLSL